MIDSFLHARRTPDDSRKASYRRESEHLASLYHMAQNAFRYAKPFNLVANLARRIKDY